MKLAQIIPKYKKSAIFVIVSFLLAAIGMIANITGVFSWIGITPKDVKTFLETHSITLNLWQLTLLVISNLLLLIVSFFIMRHILNRRIDKKINLDKIKSDTEKLDETKQQFLHLIDDWKKLYELRKNIQIHSHPQYSSFQSRVWHDEPTEFTYTIRNDDEIMRKYNQLKDETDTKLGVIASTYPKISTLAQKIKEESISTFSQSRSYIEEDITATFNTIIDTLENIHKIL